MYPRQVVFALVRFTMYPIHPVYPADTHSSVELTGWFPQIDTFTNFYSNICKTEATVCVSGMLQRTNDLYRASLSVLHST